MQDKEVELARAKRRALFALLAATALFVATLPAPEHWWVVCLRMMAEAAMVGGLADWFAVRALFRRIPARFTVPYLTAHTAVIPRGKDRIADSLAAFVQEKFLDPESLAALIRRHDIAGHVASWLQQGENTGRVAHFLLRFVDGLLDWVEVERIQRLLRDATQAAVAKVDLSAGAAGVLETLTEGGRHQQVLDHVLARLLQTLEDRSTREFIAGRIVRWLKEDHPGKQKVLPTQWIGEQGSRLIADNLMDILDEIRNDQAHGLRQVFDRQLAGLVERLKSDPALQARGEEIKRYLLEDDAFGDYLNGLWAQLADWLRQDLARADSAMQRHVQAGAAWLAQQLAGDPALRDTLNQRLEEAARGAAPDFAAFLADHIRDTVRRWDAEDLSRQVELNIGAELQAIRLNGTLMGGAIGLVLFAVMQAVRALAS